MSASDSLNAFFASDPLDLAQYWTTPLTQLPPGVYGLTDPAGEWSAYALADGEVTLINSYDCLNADGEPDTCEQEFFIEDFPAFFYRLLALRDRCEGYFDNDTWQQ